MTEKKEMVGLKVSANLKESLMALRETLGMTHEEYVQHLITLVEKERNDGEGFSPVLREQNEIEQFLSRAAIVCKSKMELSVARQQKAQEDADALVATAQAKVAELRTLVADQKETLSLNETEIAEKDLLIERLQDAAESTATLKEAWAEKELMLTNNISKFEAKEQYHKAFLENFDSLQNELAEKEMKIALQAKDYENISLQLQDMKTSISKIETELNEQKEKTDRAEQQLVREQVSGAEKLAAVQTDMAKKQGELLGQVRALKNELLRKKGGEDPISSLDADLKQFEEDKSNPYQSEKK